MNNLAVIEQMSGLERNSAAVLFQKAAELGSGQAAANLALIHLAGARLNAGLEALKLAQEKGAFEKHSDITNAVQKLEAILNAPQETASTTAQQGNTKPANTSQQNEQPQPNQGG